MPKIKEHVCGGGCTYRRIAVGGSTVSGCSGFPRKILYLALSSFLMCLFFSCLFVDVKFY